MQNKITKILKKILITIIPSSKNTNKQNTNKHNSKNLFKIITTSTIF